MANACGVETSEGAVLFYEDPLDTTMKAIGGVTGFPQFAFTHNTGSCDDDSAAGWDTSYKTGRKIGGDTTLTYNWVPGDAVQALMWDAFVNSDTDKFMIQWADTGATSLTFDANVTGFGVATPPKTSDDNKITRDISIKVTGEPIWA